MIRFGLADPGARLMQSQSALLDLVFRSNSLQGRYPSNLQETPREIAGEKLKRTLPVWVRVIWVFLTTVS